MTGKAAGAAGAARARAASGSGARAARRPPVPRRCDWVGDDPLYVEYHDREWGVPLHDDRALFELLVLEGAQAGLSWLTILRKRAHYRRVFAGFDPGVVARFREPRIARLLRDPGIVRNERKLRAAVANAARFLEVQREAGSFDAFLWQFVGGAPRRNRFRRHADVPARTPESEALSAALSRRGFRFVGPTICYAYMQAAGLVNDHLVACFRHREV